MMLRKADFNQRRGLPSHTCDSMFFAADNVPEREHVHRADDGRNLMVARALYMFHRGEATSSRAISDWTSCLLLMIGMLPAVHPLRFVSSFEKAGGEA